MSIISASTTSTTAYKVTADTTGTLVLQTGSTPTTAVTIDGSQNVTLAGNITLNNGAADGAQLSLASSGYSNWNIDNYTGRFRWYYNTTEYMTLDASGRLGIGQTSPTNLLDVYGSSASLAQFYRSTSASGLKLSADSGGAVIMPVTIDAIQFYNAAGTTVNAKIDSSGNLLVGTTSKLSGGIPGIDINNSAGGITFGVSGSSKAYVYTSPSVSRFITESVTGYTIAMISGGSNGVVLANGGTSWGSLSDERKKDIIEPITNAATKISTLRTVIGKYKSDEEGTRRAFLIAQDVQAVLPEAVSEDNGDLLLQYTDTIPLLVAAIKEQQAIIETLTNRITALEAK